MFGAWLGKRNRPRQLTRFDAKGVQDGPWDNYDSHAVYSSSHRRYWSNLYDRWCRVVKLSDRVDVEWLTQVPPVAVPSEGTLPVSGIGTIAAANVKPKDEDIEPFTVVSMYGRWMGSHPPPGKKNWTSMLDTAVHRIISDLSLFVGREDPSTHRVVVAGDINLDYGWREDKVSWTGKKGTASLG